MLAYELLAVCPAFIDGQGCLRESIDYKPGLRSWRPSWISKIVGVAQSCRTGNQARFVLEHIFITNQ